MCPVREIFLEFAKSALEMRPLLAIFLESTKNVLKMCSLRALSLEFTKSAHKFALFKIISLALNNARCAPELQINENICIYVDLIEIFGKAVMSKPGH